MKTSSKNFYVTTPIFNAAKPPRVGQLYSSVSADAIARYRKMCNDRVFFLTGAVYRFEGSVQEQVDGRHDYVQEFLDSWSALNIGYDHLVTVQDELHSVAAFKFLSLLKARGFIYRASFDESRHHWSSEDTLDKKSDSLYFFKLSELLDKLEEFYDDNPTFVIPQVSRTRIIGLSRQNLKDICIFQGEIGETLESSQFTCSRWFGALVGYLSGIGFGSDEQHFSSLWPAEVQMVGEYAITSQALFWPSILMAAGIEPPRHILVNRSLSFKFSEEEEDSPELAAVLKALPEDVFRYVLLRKVELEEDSVITLQELQEVINSDLSQGIAGQVSRISKMLDNFFDGRIPEPGLTGAADKELIRYCQETVKLYRENFASLNISKVLDCIWELIAFVNRYLVATEPWKIARDASKKEKLGAILYNIAEAMRIICMLLHPIIPASSLKMMRQLGASTESADLMQNGFGWGGLKPGDSIVNGEIVIPPLNIKKIRTAIESGVAGTGESGPGEEYSPLAPEVTIDDFARIDIRVARIIEAERIAKSNKLIKLQVDLGFEKRQVIAGIGEEYDPSDLTGKVVAIVANLKPAKLMGEISRGMIVAASDKGKPSLVVFDRNTRIGSRLS